MARTTADPFTLAECLTLLAALFWGPDRNRCLDLFARDLPYLRGKAATGAPELVKALADLAATAPDQRGLAAICRKLGEAHVRLFVSAPGKVPAPPYASAYTGDGRLMGPPALAMAERLDRAGLTLDKNSNEPADHLCLELEYLAELVEKSAGANDSEGLAEAASFAREEVLPWVGRFRQALAQADPPAQWTAAGALLAATLCAVAALDPAEACPRG